MILCTTPSLSVDSTPDSRLVVQFDDAVIYGDTFLYIEDPMISDVQPEKGIFKWVIQGILVLQNQLTLLCVQ